MGCEIESILWSIFTSALFIIVLYIYPNNLSRNDSFRIKTRSYCVCFPIVLSLYILKLNGKYDLNELNIHYLFTSDFLIKGVFKPLFILFVIQLVPIIIFVKNLLEYQFVQDFDIILLRDVVLSPVAEELMYRYIQLKLLYPCFDQISSCLISSFLFGFSHFHKLLDPSQERSLFWSCFQFIFTFFFGLFASSIYFKSTYIITPIICHSICNYLTVPDFEYIFSSRILSLSTIFTFGFGLYLMAIL